MATGIPATELEQLTERLALYLAAETKILGGQEYQIGQGGTARRLRRADLTEVRHEIKAINERIALLSPVGTAGSPRRIGPVYIR